MTSGAKQKRVRLLPAVATLLLAAGWVAPRAHAEAGSEPRTMSRAEFHTELNRLQQLVVACAASTKNCDMGAVESEASVPAEGAAPAFNVRLDWLHATLRRAADPEKTKVADRTYDRDAALRAADDHLQELANQTADAAPAANEDADFAKARAESTRVLAGSEFRADPPPSWLDRKWSQFLSWLGGLLLGLGRVGEAAPWLGTLLEWLLYIGAAVGLLLLVRRAFARQRLAISLAQGAGPLSAWDREANDWADMAEARAAAGDWRDAVHCLYWAAIVRLEARRAWRHNPARTPREYVRLLKPGSPQQGALRGLTQIFERVWYGLRDADGDDYRRARSLFDGLGETGTTPTPAQESA